VAADHLLRRIDAVLDLSERRPCEEVHPNLAYRWFCRLSLQDTVPEHSTFSKNRHGRFRGSDTFRWLFDEVLRRCMAAGL
jgi:transposase